MKLAPVAIILGVAAAVAAGAALTRTRGGDDPAVAAGILRVDQLAASPATFFGREIRLTGVVSVVQPGQKRFVVIDRAEFAACRTVTCSQYRIPITYAGDLPAVETAVTVTGHLTRPEPGRYLFEATALDESEP